LTAALIYCINDCNEKLIVFVDVIALNLHLHFCASMVSSYVLLLPKLFVKILKSRKVLHCLSSGSKVWKYRLKYRILD